MNFSTTTRVAMEPSQTKCPYHLLLQKLEGVKAMLNNLVTTDAKKPSHETPPTLPPLPPPKDKCDNERQKKVLIVLYQGGEREVYCPAKKIKEQGAMAHIEFYNRIIELQGVECIEEL